MPINAREPESRKCPNCAEWIKADAILCRYCNSGISREHFGPCPFCAEMVRRDAVFCHFCRSDIPAATETKTSDEKLSLAEAIRLKVSCMENLTLPCAGNLNEIGVAQLLQMIRLRNDTGCLHFINELGKAEVYFDSGNLVHAVSKKLLENSSPSTGNEAILDIFTWDSGRFYYHPANETVERTVKGSFEGLIMSAVAFLDCNDYLRHKGITHSTVLQKSNALRTEVEVKEKLRAGFPIDIDAQINFYQEVDGKSSISTIAEKLGLNRASWLPTVFNLVTCQLAKTCNEQDHRNT